MNLVVLAKFAKREAFEIGLEVNERRPAFQVKIYNTYTHLPGLLPAPCMPTRNLENQSIFRRDSPSMSVSRS